MKHFIDPKIPLNNHMDTNLYAAVFIGKTKKGQVDLNAKFNFRLKKK